MVNSLQIWVDKLLQLQPQSSAEDGARNLGNYLKEQMDKVQAGPTGVEGIFHFDVDMFVSTLIASGFNPTSSMDWVPKISSAWYAASAGNTITPSTVTDPAWTISIKDTNTVPVGATTILTLSSAKTMLENELQEVTFSGGKEPSAVYEAFAKSFRDSLLSFVFNCIGIAGPPPTPLPIPKNAQ